MSKAMKQANGRRLAVAALALGMFLAASPLASAQSGTPSTYQPPFDWSVGSPISVQAGAFCTYDIWIKDFDTWLVQPGNTSVQISDYQQRIDVLAFSSMDQAMISPTSSEGGKKTYSCFGYAKQTPDLYEDDFKFWDGRASTEILRDPPVYASKVVNVAAPP